MNFNASPPVSSHSTNEGTITANASQITLASKVILSSLETFTSIRLPLYIRPLTGQIFPRGF